jgi:GTP-binding protein EngB required for normal cell division
MVPFIIVGTKKDKKDKLKVTKEETASLMQVLKKHMKCDHAQSSSENPEDISIALNRLLSLASSHLFPHYKHMN